ncbi:hypothetical protein [Jeotgalibacillus soli]|uniref:FkbM family methyltransferase n=1 Tax=Jeotgalibacillus soli TaxID=889306 RepID=A0A0C2VZX1_9BACL|nr:hypothetical protein [Jeotgalibacillus soli]KIL49921.1 hypothetical protein KP78_13890 [Jeotgalibacillus soli]
MLSFQGYSVLFYIDRNEIITDQRILDKVPVYKDISKVPQNILKEIDMLMVALGNKTAANEVKAILSKFTNVTVKTIHEQPYESIYLNMSQKKLSYLEECGFYRSRVEHASVDKDGSPLPWIAYPCIEFLSTRITKDLNVFEYGSGSSTLWWSEKVNKVFSVEHDKEWFEKTRKQLINPNVDLVYKKLAYNGQYSKEVLKHRDLDIVVIDGRDRVNCAINSAHSLSKRGVIIWDNTDRISYEEGYKFLQDKGYKRIDFIGMMPMFDFKSQTSIFYKDKNWLNL